VAHVSAPRKHLSAFPDFSHVGVVFSHAWLGMEGCEILVGGKHVKDDPDDMLRESWIYYAIFWLAVLSLCFLSACTPTVTVDHEVPQLDRLGDAVKKIVVQDCAKPTLAMPPIPQECVIDIRGDSMTASSKDCEDLVRFYAAARRLLKPAAPTSTTLTGKP
jgi:hypothetical protein